MYSIFKNSIDFDLIGVSQAKVEFWVHLVLGTLLFAAIWLGFKEFQFYAHPSSKILEIENSNLLIGYAFLHESHQVLLQRKKAFFLSIPLKHIKHFEITKDITPYYRSILNSRKKILTFSSWIALTLRDSEDLFEGFYIKSLRENIVLIYKDDLGVEEMELLHRTFHLREGSDSALI